MSRRNKGDAALFLISAKAGNLGEEVLPVLKFMAGFSVPLSVSEETIGNLVAWDICRQDINLLDGKSVLLLTGYGKKIVAVMQENPKDFQVGA